MAQYQTDIQALGTDPFRAHVGTIVSRLQTDDGLAGKMASGGWTAERTAALASLFETYVGHARAFQDLGGARNKESGAFEDAEQAFRTSTFRRDYRTADAVFHGEDEVQASLRMDDGLNNLQTPFAEWSVMASDFYERLTSDPEMQERLRAYNVSIQDLRDHAAELDDLTQQHTRREDLYADRQQARRDRDAARRAVEHEFRRMQKFGLIALQGTEDLEKIGFVFTDDVPAGGAEAGPEA